jgi:hypothetical protein
MDAEDRGRRGAFTEQTGWVRNLAAPIHEFIATAEVGWTQRRMAPDDMTAPIAEINPAHRQFFHPHALLDRPRDPLPSDLGRRT